MSHSSPNLAGRLRRRAQEDPYVGIDDANAVEKQEADLLDEKPHPRTPRTPRFANGSPALSPRFPPTPRTLILQRGLSQLQQGQTRISPPSADTTWWTKSVFGRLSRSLYSGAQRVFMAAGVLAGTYDAVKADDNQKARGRAATRQMYLVKLLCFVLVLIVVVIGLVRRLSPGSIGSDRSPMELKRTWGGLAWEKQVKKSCRRSDDGRLVVLVTGAAGFVGSHVSIALKKRGDGVLGLDNFNDYYPVALKRARQNNLLEKHIFIVEADLNDQELLALLFGMVKFTHVLHLAAQAGVRYAVKNPLAYVHSNVAGFVTLMEECKAANPQPAIVYASSSSVYGLNTKVPFSEDDRTDQPASLYAATKKSDEVLGHTYNHIYGLSITALRFFTVYGPWGRPDMAYFSFTRNIVEGQPIKIFQGPGDIELARDFTYIDDVVKGCVASLDTAEPSTGSGGKKKAKAQFRVFNLGNTQPVKVGDFVSILEKHLKKKADRKYIPMPSTGDVMFTHANVTRARLALGYEPSTDLETGLKHFVKWYQSYFKEGSGQGEGTLDGYKPY